MNFVDEQLEIRETLSAAELVSAITEMWHTTDHGITEELSLQYPQFIQDLLHIADFDSACNWNGLEYFVKANDHRGFLGTIAAFERCGYIDGVRLLCEIGEKDDVRKRHETGKGRLGKNTLALIQKIEPSLYYQQEDTKFWNLVESYVENTCGNGYNCICANASQTTTLTNNVS